MHSHRSPSSLHLFEIFCAMLAQRADEIRGKNLAFVNISADLADPTLLLIERGGLWLDVVEIVGIGHRRHIAQNLSFGHIGDENGVRAVIIALNDLCGDEGIRGFGDVIQSVFAALDRIEVAELIDIPAALESKVLEEREGGIRRQDGYVEFSAVQDEIMRIIRLVDGDGNALRRIGDLRHGIDDAAVVAAALRGKHE